MAASRRGRGLRRSTTSKLATYTPGVLAVQRTSRTVPIVFVGVIDPVGSSLVKSLARPGSNATGFLVFESHTEALGSSAQTEDTGAIRDLCDPKNAIAFRRGRVPRGTVAAHAARLQRRYRLGGLEFENPSEDLLVVLPCEPLPCPR